MNRFKIYSIINIFSGFTLAVMSPIIVIIFLVIILPFSILGRLLMEIAETFRCFSNELVSFRGIVTKQIKLGIDQWSRK